MSELDLKLSKLIFKMQADHLGVPATLLRRAQIQAVSQQIPLSEIEQDLVMEDDQGNPLDNNTFELAEWDGIGAKPTLTVVPNLKHSGMVLHSNSNRDVIGIDIALNGQGSDDDVHVSLVITGCKPNGETITTTVSSGEKTITLPHAVVNDLMTFTFTNMNRTTKMTISVTGYTKPEDGDVALSARKSMAEVGLPIGKSEDILQGFIADTINGIFDERIEAIQSMQLGRKSGNRALMEQAHLKRKNASSTTLENVLSKAPAILEEIGFLGRTGTSIGRRRANKPKNLSSLFGRAVKVLKR
jgi:hypothetical protein